MSATRREATQTNHAKRVKHPSVIDTLRDHLMEGAVDDIRELLEHSITLDALSKHNKSLIAHDLINSQYCETLLNTFPVLFNLLEDQVFPDSGDTPFIAAARANNLSLMKRLHAIDPTVLNHVNREHLNALMIAAKSDTPTKESTEWLLQHSPTPLENIEVILLTLAANPEQTETFKMAIAYPDESIDLALQKKSFRRHLVNSLLIVFHQRTINIPYETLEQQHMHFLSPLYALNNRHMDELTRPNQNSLAARYHQVNHIQPHTVNAPHTNMQTRTPLGLTPVGLHLFAQKTQLQRQHRHHVTLIDEKDDSGLTALHHLLLNAPRKLLKLIKPNLTLDRRHGLWEATLHMAFTATQLITSYHTVNKTKLTLNALLMHGASIHLTTETQNTPLHLAVVWQPPAIVAHLIEQGARVNERNEHGCTPLMLACDKNKENTVDVLLAHRANTNLNSLDDLTPLMVACLKCSSRVIRKLLDAGADPRMTDKNGNNALVYLEENKIIPSDDKAMLCDRIMQTTTLLRRV